MQQSNQPAKFLLPFAQNDSTRVEIPPTSADPTRASQSEGFPPLTGTPPEAGGVPPQRQDFNGAMNQVARIPWWSMLGGRYGFDATFATDPAINGYPLGAVLPAAAGTGDWISTVNDNTANPDTVGTGWVPGYHYGATSLTGLAGGTVTLTPAQAAKRVLNVAGVLTSNLTLIVPNWVYDWTVYNNTSGAFSVTVKTATGAGVVVPQNASPTPVRCDGTVCSLVAMNIAQATSPTQAARFDQITTSPGGGGAGRLLSVQTFTAGGTYNPPTGTAFVIVEVVGGGGGSQGTPATDSSTRAVTGGAGGGGYIMGMLTSGFAAASVVVGAQTAVATTGNQSSFGNGAFQLVAGGGETGQVVTAAATAVSLAAGGGGGTTSAGASVTVIRQSVGQRGLNGFVFGGALGGDGGGAGWGGAGGLGRGTSSSTAAAAAATSYGCGAGGIFADISNSSKAGAVGRGGVVVVYAYSAV